MTRRQIDIQRAKLLLRIAGDLLDNNTRIAVALRRAVKAEAMLRQRRAAPLHRAWALGAVGRAYWQMAKPGLALPYFRRSAEAFCRLCASTDLPKETLGLHCVEALDNFGLCLFENGRCDEALVQLTRAKRRALMHHPQRVNGILRRISLVQQALGHDEGAKNSLLKAKPRGDDYANEGLVWLNARGLMHIAHNEYLSARETFRSAIDLFPKGEQGALFAAVISNAAVLELLLDAPEAAFELGGKLDEFTDASMPVSSQIGRLRLRAIILEHTGQTQSALDVWGEAKRLLCVSTNNDRQRAIDVDCNRARLLVEAGEPLQALAVLDHYLLSQKDEVWEASVARSEALCGWGRLKIGVGDMSTARSALVKVMDAERGRTDYQLLSNLYCTWSDLARAEGKVATAIALLKVGVKYILTEGHHVMDVERIVLRRGILGRRLAQLCELLVEVGRLSEAISVRRMSDDVRLDVFVTDRPRLSMRERELRLFTMAEDLRSENDDDANILGKQDFGDSLDLLLDDILPIPGQHSVAPLLVSLPAIGVMRLRLDV